MNLLSPIRLLTTGELHSSPNNLTKVPLVLGDWTDIGVKSTHIKDTLHLISGSTFTPAKVKSIDKDGRLDTNTTGYSFGMYRDLSSVTTSSFQENLRVYGVGPWLGGSWGNPVDLIYWVVKTYSKDGKTYFNDGRMAESRLYYNRNRIELRYFIPEDTSVKLLIDSIANDSGSAIARDSTGKMYIAPLGVLFDIQP